MNRVYGSSGEECGRLPPKTAPPGGTVVAGQTTIKRQGHTPTIEQGSHNAAIDSPLAKTKACALISRTRTPPPSTAVFIDGGIALPTPVSGNIPQTDKQPR